jgi:putative hydrolase of the HAD superfamily
MIHRLDETPDPDFPSMNRALAGALGVAEADLDAATPLVIETYLSSQWVAAPGAAKALVRLAGAGYSLVVVSNTMHGEMEELLVRTQLCGVSGPHAPVVAVFDSQVVGVRKPDRRIFEMGIEALGIEPANCIHVGDSLQDDVIGARAAGLTVRDGLIARMDIAPTAGK